MKCLIFIVFLIYYISPSLCSQRTSPTTFEFGVNYGRVGFYNSGKIGFFEKNTRVHIPGFNCRRLTYVRVDIYNDLTTPNVTFDYDTTTVVVQYGILQYSKSRYEVIAKYVDIPFCGGRPQVQ